MTPWTVARQAPLSMEFSRQGYWSGLPLPSPGDLPDSGIEPRSLTWQADSLLSATTEILKPVRTEVMQVHVFQSNHCSSHSGALGGRWWHGGLGLGF